jgi:hypothetical protein
MGNRLRHADDRIDLDVLWNTIRDRLPSLKADAERAKPRAIAATVRRGLRAEALETGFNF